MPDKETLNSKREAAESDAKKYSALDALAESAGGKILIASAAKDVNAAIENIVTNYQTMTEVELRTAAATLAANFNLLNVLQNAGENKKFAIDELKELGKKFEG